MGILDYTGDPRAVLMHEGNENSGRYPRGSGDRPFQHVGLRFGKRKYQNPDGTLTPAGQARFESERKKNAIKKKDNRVKDEEDLIDPSRWVQEDAESAINASKASENLIQTISNIRNKRLERAVEPIDIDLSGVEDDELRKQVNRMQLENQYARLYTEKMQAEAMKGRQYLDRVLEVAGSVLAISTSALTLSLAIKKLVN
jgi:hypothetical protein